MLPEALAAHAQARGAERVGKRDPQCALASRQPAKRGKQERDGQRHHARGGQLFEIFAPVLAGLSARDDGRNVPRERGNRGADGIERHAVVADPLYPVGLAMMEKWKIVEIEGAVI
jgi:hypothetical protein